MQLIVEKIPLIITSPLLLLGSIYSNRDDYKRHTSELLSEIIKSAH